MNAIQNIYRELEKKIALMVKNGIKKIGKIQNPSTTGPLLFLTGSYGLIFGLFVSCKNKYLILEFK